MDDSACPEESNSKTITINRRKYNKFSSSVIRDRGTVTVSSDETSSSNALKFEIVSARTVDGQRKKYVAYTVMLRVLTNDCEDPRPAVLERRYNEFLALYNSLKREFPAYLNSVEFPRKVLLGNFTPEIITSRCLGFEIFLGTIGSVSQLRHSSAVKNFMQKREMSDALKLILHEQYNEAAPIVENCFRIMNKLHTNRSPTVLQNLCLLICLYKRLNDQRALDFVYLAVRRYQGVSDADLLRYYVPLLNIAIDLSKIFGRHESSALEEHLADLKKHGYAINASTPLLKLLLHDLLPDGCKAVETVDSIDC